MAGGPGGLAADTSLTSVGSVPKSEFHEVRLFHNQPPGLIMSTHVANTQHQQAPFQHEWQTESFRSSQDRRGLARLSHYSGSLSGYQTTGRLGLRYCAIPTVPVTSASGVPSNLKVCLPPESRMANPNNPNYTSRAAARCRGIPHLESSPRKFRQQHSSGEGIEDADLENPPPKLPQKPSRGSSLSPPPLPPKKPLKSISANFAPSSSPSLNYGSNAESLYDCLPNVNQQQNLGTPEIQPTTNECDPSDLVLFQELSKMSVLELDEKIIRGELPPELRGNDNL